MSVPLLPLVAPPVLETQYRIASTSGYVAVLTNKTQLSYAVNWVRLTLGSTTFKIPNGRLDLLIMDATLKTVREMLDTQMYVQPASPSFDGVAKLEIMCPDGWGFQLRGGEAIAVIFPNDDGNCTYDWQLFWGVGKV